MNKYLNKLIMYHEVNKMKREGHSISRIAEFLGMNWRTVKKMLSMNDNEYEQYLTSQSQRSKELIPYEHFVKQKLDLFPDTSASQMQDWLKEYDFNFPEVHPKTVYNFVMWVRQEYNIPKEKKHREYLAVEELPYGKQAQVDFGEYNMRKSTGGVKKVYFFAMVLSRSRHKFIYFSDTPYTSNLAVLAHEKAFDYFQGIPKEVVYDQDNVFIHDENAGDLLLTSVFSKYVDNRKFSTWFCRKADPETKGKVENVVKYVKQNFLYNRSYYDLETLQDEAVAWLNRTANHNPHGKTKRPPYELWQQEKGHLSEYTPLKLQFDDCPLYQVRKDNVIVYKSNLYSLPVGTWKHKETKVNVEEHGNKLHIKDLSGKLICCHEIALGKGETVQNNNHKRDTTLKIDQLINDVANKFDAHTEAAKYLNLIREQKPRYIRDQVNIINKCFEKYPGNIINQTLAFCLEQAVYSASDFKSVVEKLSGQTGKTAMLDDITEVKLLSENMPDLNKMLPETSEIIDYESIMLNKN
jgi:transposase